MPKIESRAWATDKFGDEVLSWNWDWRDERIMGWINNFARISKENVFGNIGRQEMKGTGALRRSMAWKTFASSGGDTQVFTARYLYYAKYVELAVGKGMPFRQLPPDIPHKAWLPIKMPDRKRRAKPHVVTEMRSQATKFTSMARKQFSFTGTVFLIFAMGNNKSAAAAYNRAVFWANRKERFSRL